jgi:hypothetical protein
MSKNQLGVIAERRVVIAKRRGAIFDEVKALNQENNDLMREDQELSAAQRVIARLMNLPEPQPASSNGAEAPIERAGKPAGIPTVPEMADIILREAEAAGDPWREGRTIVAEIKQRWWPTVEPNDVLPTLWRLANVERLRKKGSKYAQRRKTIAEGAEPERRSA